MLNVAIEKSSSERVAIGMEVRKGLKVEEVEEVEVGDRCKEVGTVEVEGSRAGFELATKPAALSYQTLEEGATLIEKADFNLKLEIVLMV